MKTAAILSLGFLLATGTAYAQQVSAGRAELMSSVPQTSRTVTDWYKQNVYDQGNNKIGEIMDVLIEPNGQANTAIIGVGGFLGAGEKDVAVKFDSIKSTSNIGFDPCKRASPVWIWKGSSYFAPSRTSCHMM